MRPSKRAHDELRQVTFERGVARATVLEEQLSAQHQALRHHPRPVARRRQDLRLLQNEEGELRVSSTGGKTGQNPVSPQSALLVP